MLARTHLLIGIIVSVALFKFLSISHPLYFIFMTSFFAIFPDIDTFNSTIGSKVKPLSFILNLLFGHRGIMHSMFIPILACIFLFSQGYLVTGFALLIGYTSHILADSLTHEGVRPFHPLSFHVKGFIRTGGILEHIFFLLLIIIILISIKSFF
ncbi:metal-dependent hydrolase [Candidatus Woesearchaeota archaeon]|nr:metal-dependent hydrolase [Candidatus Woesearchaeota archaeon]